MWGFLMTLWHSPRGGGGDLDPIWASKFSLSFTRTMWFLWDLALMLFGIPKDVVFAEILVFSNIFGFPAVNWAPKWTKTVDFQCVLFEPNFKSLKDFPSSVFVLLNSLWSKFQQDGTIFGGIRARKPKKGLFHGFSINTSIFEIFNFTTTYATLMKLTTDIYLNKVFHLAKSWGVIHRV